MSRKLSPVSQFVENNSAIPSGGIRWQIFNAETNGLAEAGAILRIGRRVLIDEDRYFRWVDEQNGITTNTA